MNFIIFGILAYFVAENEKGIKVLDETVEGCHHWIWGNMGLYISSILSGILLYCKINDLNLRRFRAMILL